MGRPHHDGAPAGSSCPTADELATPMSPQRRAAWLDHAAACAACHAVAMVLDDLPGAPAPAADAPRIDRYVLGEVIGRGAMGQVFAARDPHLDRPVAVKVLHPAVDPQRLWREAQALARLRHPAVVQVYDVGEDHGRGFVAMELVDGQNLRQWLQTPRTLAERLAVLRRAGEGLAAAHAAGLIHRDFKPDNVLIGRDGRVLVGDFGLARAVAGLDSSPGEVARATAVSASAPELTRTGAVVGTPAYMAPEQATGLATVASDQFAFCVTAWEACFGQRPFVGATTAELLAAARAGRVVRPDDAEVPRRVEAALRRGLAAAAADRFPSMAALLRALAPPRRVASPRVMAVTVVAVAVIAVVAAVAVGRARDDRRGAAAASCQAGADAIDADWPAALRGRITPDGRGAALDAWVAAWKHGFIEACEAARRDRDDPALVERLACYARHRGTFRQHVAPARRDPTIALPDPATLPVLVACASAGGAVVPSLDVTDMRGCRCPYSACDEQRRCLSVCRAAAFRIGGAVPGINVAGRQEALLGVSGDGDTVLYVAGERPGFEVPLVRNNWQCQLQHLYLARRRGATFVPVELTPQLDRAVVAVAETCCTLAADGRSIIGRTRDRRGFVRMALDGDRLGPPRGDEFAAITAALPADATVAAPVLAADERTLYFVVVQGTDAVSGPAAGPAEANRAATDRPFGPAARIIGRGRYYESVSGVSSDGLTLFMNHEFTTRVLARARLDEPFDKSSGGAAPWTMPGFRAKPTADCSRILTTGTPGGCAQEDIIYLEAEP